MNDPNQIWQEKDLIRPLLSLKTPINDPFKEHFT